MKTNYSLTISRSVMLDICEVEWVTYLVLHEV